MDDRETWLAATLVELADTSVIVDFDDSAYGLVLVAHLTELLDHAEIGLIILDPAGAPQVAAASTPRARQVLSSELDADDGPCVSCYRGGQRQLNLDIGTAATRWPRFASVARGVGFRTATTLPMRRRCDVIGAVGILDAGHRPLAEPDLSLAQMLAEAATVGLSQRRMLLASNRAAAQLQHALDSRVVIEQAKGMLAAWLGITPGAAFALLRDYSRGHNRRLAEVADDVIRRALAAPELLAAVRSGRPASTD
ncbi:MAG TPA: GAF and ANTAR domain-containing protein [Pseudonocardiaceae bacterium]|nr:GAF and ANTAR domain-containing protein [Pseudonocardiaceae bacterium]